MTTFLGIAFETLVIFLLVAANGFFVAAEFALVKVRASQLRPLAKTGGWRVKFALRATQHLDAALSATQLGITLASLGLGWVGEPYLAHRIQPLLAHAGVSDPTAVHSIAFAPKEDLHSRITDCSQAGFNMAMDVSCHSFIRMARMAEPLMTSGGCLLTVTFYGSEKVVEEYNVMGPVKAALESTVRYIAAELGPKRIRVHALSPGPLRTRAASGIDRFDELLERSRSRTPEHLLVGIDDIGNVATFLVSDAAAALTGNIEYIDAGYHILG